MRLAFMFSMLSAFSVVSTPVMAGELQDVSDVVASYEDEFKYLPSLTYGEVQDCSLTIGLMYNFFNAKHGPKDESTIGSNLSYLWWNKALSSPVFLDNPGPNFYTRSKVLALIIDDTKTQKQLLDETAVIGGNCLEMQSSARKMAGKL